METPGDSFGFGIGGAYHYLSPRLSSFNDVTTSVESWRDCVTLSVASKSTGFAGLRILRSFGVATCFGAVRQGFL